MKYEIVSEPNQKYLIASVDSLIRRGWKLQGGMVFSPDGWCHQTMTKDDVAFEVDEKSLPK